MNNKDHYVGAYAGIGARKTPQNILDYMSDQARILQDKGLILRTGDADGADKAFRNATEHKLVYTPNQPIEQWARDEVSLVCDTEYGQMKPYTQNLLARNMYQLFGSGARKDARQPSMFVLYWSLPSSQWDAGLHNNNYYNCSGGTRYAVRAACDAGIPTFNLYNQRQHWETYRDSDFDPLNALAVVDERKEVPPDFIPAHCIYQEGWLSNELANQIWLELRKPSSGVTQKSNSRWTEPRLTTWFSEQGVVYNYSGIEQSSFGWPDWVEQLAQMLASNQYRKPNSLLVNVYRSGNDKCSMHKDDEPLFDLTQPIFSVSLGATRAFTVSTNRTSIEFTQNLTSGSLFTMLPGFQEKYFHGIPQEPDIQEPRINLTFRYVKPEEPQVDVQVNPPVAKPVKKTNPWGVPDEVIEALKAELK